MGEGFRWKVPPHIAPLRQSNVMNSDPCIEVEAVTGHRHSTAKFKVLVASEGLRTDPTVEQPYATEDSLPERHKAADKFADTDCDPFEQCLFLAYEFAICAANLSVRVGGGNNEPRQSPHIGIAVTRDKLRNSVWRDHEVVIEKKDDFASALPDAEVSSSGKVGLC